MSCFLTSPTSPTFVCIAFSQRGVLLHLSQKKKRKRKRKSRQTTDHPRLGKSMPRPAIWQVLSSNQVYGSVDTWAVFGPRVISAAGRNFAVQLNADRHFWESSSWIMMDLPRLFSIFYLGRLYDYHARSGGASLHIFN